MKNIKKLNDNKIKKNIKIEKNNIKKYQQIQ